MTRDGALFQAEARFYIVAVLVLVVGATQSYLMPVWASACLVIAFMISTNTPRQLKETRLREDA